MGLPRVTRQTENLPAFGAWRLLISDPDYTLGLESENRGKEH